MNLFLICGGLGLILTLFSMFSGTDGDFDHDVSHDGGISDDHSTTSIFSFRIIVIFLTVFGAVGALFKYYEFNMLVSSIAGVVAGIIMAFISRALMNFTLKQQASSLVSNKQMVGLKAIVTTSIPKDGLGEVMVELSGQRKYMSARSKDGYEISNNSQVEISEEVSGVLTVSKQIQ